MKGIGCRVYLGVPASERRVRQDVLVDVEMRLDLSRAALSDSVRDTVDYAALEAAVRRLAETGEFKLAERLAVLIAGMVLAFDGRIRRARVAVHKKPAVMPGTREVVVEIEHNRR
ncbi:MAG: dihydroneopterin aldolase [Elusimicrobia bacterium]|nr:dihydroneopterin aldolase [Elusimicrobiota bacterium]